MCLEWISVEDRLPDVFEAVMVVFDQGYIKPHCSYWEGDWYEEGVSLDGDEEVSIITTTVTHWMPFPAPPQASEASKSNTGGEQTTVGDAR